MEFLTWWFNQHWIISTFFMPMWQLVWSIYMNQAFHAVIAGIWLVVFFLGWMLSTAIGSK